MAGQVFLTISNGLKAMARGLQASAGAGSAGQLIAANSAGQIDSTFLPASASGQTTVTATASAAITAGQLVNLYNNAGVLTAKPADNTTTGSPAHGFALTAISASATGTINLAGLNTALSGLTIGAYYWLGAAGAVTNTPPTTAGYNLQLVGEAVSATSLEFVPDYPITVA